MSWIEKNWYREQGKLTLTAALLSPLSLLFWVLSSIRRGLFRVGIKKQHRLAVPVVIIGNISVGGNGKTPLVVRLAQWLKQQGYHPGVLSRGYGGKGANYPMTVERDSDAAVVGDEPAFMRQHIHCPLVVDPDRVRGANHLINEHKCNIILCDDGLQHYRLGRDIEIVVMDGVRRTGNGFLLPMGPLREGQWRLDTVDFVVCNGGGVKSGEHPMTLEPGRLVNVKYPQQNLSVAELKRPVTAVAAIGNPDRFFDLLRAKQVKLKDCIAFADHHQFTERDMPEGTVLMTEKDAIKCRGFASDDWWYLPVTAKLTEEFKQQLHGRLKAL